MRTRRQAEHVQRHARRRQRRHRGRKEPGEGAGVRVTPSAQPRKRRSAGSCVRCSAHGLVVGVSNNQQRDALVETWTPASTCGVGV